MRRHLGLAAVVTLALRAGAGFGVAVLVSGGHRTGKPVGSEAEALHYIGLGKPVYVPYLRRSLPSACARMREAIRTGV
jgi:hypothetical protein